MVNFTLRTINLFCVKILSKGIILLKYTFKGALKTLITMLTFFHPPGHLLTHLRFSINIVINHKKS
jgi:hypothetical protein